MTFGTSMTSKFTCLIFLGSCFMTSATWMDLAVSPDSQSSSMSASYVLTAGFSVLLRTNNGRGGKSPLSWSSVFSSARSWQRFGAFSSFIRVTSRLSELRFFDDPLRHAEAFGISLSARHCYCYSSMLLNSLLKLSFRFIMKPWILLIPLTSLALNCCLSPISF